MDTTLALRFGSRRAANARTIYPRPRASPEDSHRARNAGPARPGHGRGSAGAPGLPYRPLGLGVELAALFHELDGLLLHSLLDVVAHVLRDLHRAEVRPAHRAEVRDLGAFLRQRLVVELPGGVRVEAEVELVGPAEFKARLGQRVVAQLRARMALGEVGGWRGDIVRHDAVLHVLLVRQSKVLLGSHVAQHRRAEPADHRRADRARNVVVAGCDVGRERPEGVERRLVAVLELQLHVLLDELHRHVARALDHHLAVVLPRNAGQFTQRAQLRDLRLVVGVVDRARPQPVAEREGDVVRRHDLADLLEARVEEAFLVVRQAPLRHDRAAARHDSRHALRGERDERQANSGVDGEVVHALLGLLDQRVAEYLPGQFFSATGDFFQRLIDRHRADGNGAVADDPFARLVDVLAGGEVHHRVGAPADRPGHLVDFLADGRGTRRVAKVAVDLHQEVAADDHRLAFGVIDVRRDDGAPARHLVPYELRRDALRQLRPERFTRVLKTQCVDRALVLAQGDELHLRRDDALARVMHLRDATPPPRSALEIKTQFGELRIGEPFAAVLRGRSPQDFRIAPLGDPALS